MENEQRREAKKTAETSVLGAPLPYNEQQRLAALRDLDILDTTPESLYDDVTQLASAICQTPIALVSLVDENRQWFKSRFGVEASETPRDWAFCAHAILQKDIFEVRDATQDPRFVNNPLVLSDPMIRFYAGVPLVGPGQQSVGTLCVIDRKPRELTQEQQAALKALGRQVVSHFEQRLVLKRSLLEKNRLNQAILNSADCAIISTNPEGLIQTVNRTAERWLGYRADELIGHATLAALHDPEQIRTRSVVVSGELGRAVDPGVEVFVAKARTGVTEVGEWDYVRKDGSGFPVQLSVTALTGEDGRVFGFLAVANDITERRQWESAVVKGRRQAEDNSVAKSEFLANMSHEIRTPMNGVIGMTGLLLETDLNPTQLDYARTVLNSANTLLRVINDILDFSKIEAGKLEFEIADFDPRELVEDSVRLLAERATAKGIELLGNVAPDVCLRLRGDAGRVQQVLVNLLSNAVKFTSEGEVVLKVSQESDSADEVDIRFEVTDTGLGIPHEVQARLFQKFSQAAPGTARKFGGTGLGLAISKQLVELMGGAIGVQSKPGKGSKFWFTVRFSKQTAESGTPPEDKDGLDRLKGLRILIVDDNDSNRDFLADQIRSWNLRVEGFGNLRDAFDKLKQAASLKDPFGLVLLDQEMPGEDGLSFAGRVSAEPALSGLRIVLMAPFGCQFDREALNRSGVLEKMTKPVRQSMLFDTLMNVMARGGTGNDADGKSAVPAADSSGVASEMPIRILVAEDNDVNRKVVLGQLNRLGYSADAVVNGREAVEACVRSPYDVILMDCQMPEMDGYEATREIRNREASGAFGTRTTLHIVAVTAHAMKGDREKCLSAGMDDYLTKPLKSAVLQEALERWARESKSRGGSGAWKDAAGAIAGSSAQSGEVPEGSGGEPVDLARLWEMGADDQEVVRELVDLYNTQAEELLASLKQAVSAGQAAEVKGFSHKLCGASATCGMNAIVPSLRELEAMGERGELSGAQEALETASREYIRIRGFLEEKVPKS
jgi:PAS domain S-box-containing protein